MRYLLLIGGEDKTARPSPPDSARERAFLAARLAECEPAAG
jgi:hypothetical protein